MVAVSADDYAWFTEQCAELADACWLTLVRGRAPREVIEQLGGASPKRLIGVRRLAEQAGTTFVAATALDGWTLVIGPEINARQLSRGTVLVSHSAERFRWARDGETVLEFDPADATRRTGTDPDGLVEVLAELGFDVAGGVDSIRDEDGADPFWTDDARHRERSLALAERLTGVPLTLEALEEASFSYVTEPAPGAAVPEQRRPIERPPAKPEKWDEEYEADVEDDDASDSDDRDEGDSDDREWPRLIARVRQAFTR